MAETLDPKALTPYGRFYAEYEEWWHRQDDKTVDFTLWLVNRLAAALRERDEARDGLIRIAQRASRIANGQVECTAWSAADYDLQVVSAIMPFQAALAAGEANDVPRPR